LFFFFFYIFYILFFWFFWFFFVFFGGCRPAGGFTLFTDPDGASGELRIARCVFGCASSENVGVVRHSSSSNSNNTNTNNNNNNNGRIFSIRGRGAEEFRWGRCARRKWKWRRDDGCG
jgi:hypothetical protein